MRSTAVLFLCLAQACSAPLPEPDVLARDPAALRAEIEQLFELLDLDRDGRLVENELAGALVDLLEDDLDSDGALTRDELEQSLSPALLSARFEARGDELVVQGLIDGSTPARLAAALGRHPRAKRLVLARVDGSLDQEATFAAGRLLRARGLATHVPADGVVASGGVDLFLAGLRRTAEPGAAFGVHSWELELLDLSLEGRDLPRAHPEHEPQLEYLRELAIPEELYWFTLETACAHEMHWLTAEELVRFRVLDPPDPRVGPATEKDEGDGGPLAAVRFLAGGWRAERGGLVFEELWSEPAGGIMLGFGRALRGERVVSFEHLRLEARDGELFYVASPNGRDATRFSLVESARDAVAFENPEHDDPRRIAYTLHADGTLSARLSRELGPEAKPTFGFDFQPAELVRR